MNVLQRIIFLELNEELQELPEKKDKKITNPFENVKNLYQKEKKDYINPDLNNSTNHLIEEYIEKLNNSCKLWDYLDSFHSQKSLIPPK